MRIALDTSAYIALQRGHEQLAYSVRAADTVGLPIIVLGELWFGFLNGTRLSENSATLDRFLAVDRVSVLNVTAQTARLFGEIATLLRRQGNPIQQDDMWIAALCKEHGYILATADRGYRHVLGLQLLEL